MRVLIGVACGELGRYSMSHASMMHIQNGGHEVAIEYARGTSIAVNRNVLAEIAIDTGADYLLCVDDDEIFSTDILIKLIHHDVDVVSGLYSGRNYPFMANVWMKEFDPIFYLQTPLTPDMHGLTEVAAAPGGCLLIKTSVFAKLDKPYWTIGQITPTEPSEDMYFCRQLKRVGIKIYCDLDATVGHYYNCVLWPYRDKDTGEWYTGLMEGDKLIAAFKAPKLRKE